MPDHERFQVVGKGLGTETAAPPKRMRLADVWGKTLLSVSLPAWSFVDLAAPLESEAVRALPLGVTVKRSTPTEEGYLATLSDGTELACAALLFADGPESQARLFWDKPALRGEDKAELRCWAFVTDNLISSKDWEFRWSSAKSIELLPWPENRMLVKLRFKSGYGGQLSGGELRDLFSEFGSDMTALFEGISAENLPCLGEAAEVHSVFHPASGVLSLGRAAWSPLPFMTFAWLDKFVQSQIKCLADQAQNPRLSFESVEAQSVEMMKTLEQASGFVSGQLHLDNPLLRPLRNALVSLLPNALLAPKIRARMFL